MKNPNVQFQLKQDLDQWTAEEFRVGTADDVKNFYAASQGDLERFIKNAKENWDLVSEFFYGEVSKFFKDHSWPVGAYIGYASMFDCNPRFLDNKTFQIYYKHKAGSNYVTAHELLHFIFYDYALKNHPDLFKDRDTESGIFWDTAEIFNSVVLHTSSFSGIHNAKEQIMYPEHKEFVRDLNNRYKKIADVNDLIIDIYNLIKLAPEVGQNKF